MPGQVYASLGVVPTTVENFDGYPHRDDDHDGPAVYLRMFAFGEYNSQTGGLENASELLVRYALPDTETAMSSIQAGWDSESKRL